MVARVNPRRHSQGTPNLSLRGSENEFVDEVRSVDPVTLKALDRVLEPGMIAELRLVVNNISIRNNPSLECGVLLLNDGTAVPISPEFLMILLNHPRFHRNPAPIAVLADIRRDPGISLDMMLANSPEPEFEFYVDTDDTDEL